MLKKKLFHVVGLGPALTFSFTPYTIVLSDGSSVTAEVSPQRWKPLVLSKFPVSGLALWLIRMPGARMQPSVSSFPLIRTCALMLLVGSVDDHVTKRVPALLATIAGLKSNDEP